MDAVYELKEMLCEELEEYGKKDKLDVGGLEIVDKLAHTIKNLDKIIETYEDDGYLLLIWEFHDGEDPVIHYRTWQPDRIGSHTLTKEEIINIMDFNIPTLE